MGTLGSRQRQAAAAAGRGRQQQAGSRQRQAQTPGHGHPCTLSPWSCRGAGSTLLLMWATGISFRAAPSKPAPELAASQNARVTVRHACKRNPASEPVLLGRHRRRRTKQGRRGRRCTCDGQARRRCWTSPRLPCARCTRAASGGPAAHRCACGSTCVAAEGPLSMCVRVCMTENEQMSECVVWVCASREK